MERDDHPRFYHPGTLDLGDLIDLAPDETTHAAGSLRLHSGDRVVLLNGEGVEATATIVDIHRRQLQLRVDERRDIPRPAGPEVWLAASVIRGPRFDLVLEKATEIGVDVIVPLLARHGEVKPAGHEKPERWRRIVVAAMKQSKQVRAPRLLEPQPLEDLLASRNFDGLWAAHPGKQCSEPAAPPATATSWLLLTGPEGGWHPAELTELRRAGAGFISLGPNRLRAETAALTLLIHFHSQRGSLGPATPLNFEGFEG